MRKKSISKKSILRRLCFIAFIIYVCFVLVDMQISIADKNDELVVLQQQCETQRIHNKDLQRQISESVEDKEVERIARWQLDYVSPDEKVFQDVSGS